MLSFNLWSLDLAELLDFTWDENELSKWISNENRLVSLVLVLALKIAVMCMLVAGIVVQVIWRLQPSPLRSFVCRKCWVISLSLCCEALFLRAIFMLYWAMMSALKRDILRAK